VKFKEKILKTIERAKQRNEMLISLFKTSAINIQYVMEEKLNIIRRRKELRENMKGMTS
jgi:hypothetical protein